LKLKWKVKFIYALYIGPNMLNYRTYLYKKPCGVWLWKRDRPIIILTGLPIATLIISITVGVNRVVTTLVLLFIVSLLRPGPPNFRLWRDNLTSLLSSKLIILCQSCDNSIFLLLGGYASVAILPSPKVLVLLASILHKHIIELNSIILFV